MESIYVLVSWFMGLIERLAMVSQRKEELVGTRRNIFAVMKQGGCGDRWCFSRLCDGGQSLLLKKEM